MSLFSKFTAQLKKEFSKKETFTSSMVRPIEMNIAEIPKIIEKRNREWVLYGEDNLYPNCLAELPFGSAIHGSILKTKSKMMNGDGFLINGAKTKEESNNVYNSLQPTVKAQFDWFVKNPNNEPLLKIKEKLCWDLQTYGSFAYEIVYNSDFSKIVTIKHVDVKNIRAGKMEEGKVKEYYYSRNWELSNQRGFEYREIYAFDPNDKEHMNQLVYEKVGTLDYYGVPSYSGAINWIYTDQQMGVFHNANISNGMNPGLHFKFYKLPGSQDAEDAIIEGIKRTWRGASKAGKELVTFSDGKDLSMDVQPIETSNLDKQLLLLAELCDKKILSGHQLTSPLLAGISVSGQLGGNTELQTAYHIFDKVTIEADRQMLTDSLQRILDYNKVPVKLDINPFNPFVNGN